MMSDFMKNFSQQNQKFSGDKIMNNFKQMVQDMEIKDKLTPRLSEKDLKERNLLKLNYEGSILKIGGNGDMKGNGWSKGSNALFRYKSYAFIPAYDANDTRNDKQKHHHDHHQHENCSKIESKDMECAINSNKKPIRNLIASSDDDGELFQIRLGMGFTVEFFELCLKSMRIGEKANFLVMPSMLPTYIQMEKTLRKERKNPGSASFSFGCCGQETMKDGLENMSLACLEYSPLEIEIELCMVQEPGSFKKETWEMNIKEKLEEIPKLKNEGGNLYGQKKFKEASKNYERAIVLLESIVLGNLMVEAERELQKKQVLDQCTFDDCELAFKEGIDPKEVYNLLKLCRLNYSACCLKTEDFKPAVSQCSEVLKKDPKNVKALFRRAQAYLRIGRDLELAHEDLKKLKTILPENEQRDVVKEERLLEKKLGQHLEKEKNMYSNIFKW